MSKQRRHSDHTRLPGSSLKFPGATTPLVETVDGAPTQEIDPNDEISQAHTVDIAAMTRSTRAASSSVPPALVEQLLKLVGSHNKVAEQAFEQRHIDEQLKSIRGELRDDSREHREQLASLHRLAERNDEILHGFIKPMVGKVQVTLDGMERSQLEAAHKLDNLNVKVQAIENAHKSTDQQIELIKLQQANHTLELQTVGRRIEVIRNDNDAKIAHVGGQLTMLGNDLAAVRGEVASLREDHHSRITVFEVEKSTNQIEEVAKTKLLRKQYAIGIALIGFVSYVASHFRSVLAFFQGK